MVARVENMCATNLSFVDCVIPPISDLIIYALCRKKFHSLQWLWAVSISTLCSLHFSFFEILVLLQSEVLLSQAGKTVELTFDGCRTVPTRCADCWTFQQEPLPILGISSQLLYQWMFVNRIPQSSRSSVWDESSCLAYSNQHWKNEHAPYGIGQWWIDVAKVAIGQIENLQHCDWWSKRRWN